MRGAVTCMVPFFRLKAPGACLVSFLIVLRKWQASPDWRWHMLPPFSFQVEQALSAEMLQGQLDDEKTVMQCLQKQGECFFSIFSRLSHAVLILQVLVLVGLAGMSSQLLNGVRHVTVCPCHEPFPVLCRCDGQCRSSCHLQCRSACWNPEFPKVQR